MQLEKGVAEAGPGQEFILSSFKLRLFLAAARGKRLWKPKERSLLVLDWAEGL